MTAWRVSFTDTEGLLMGILVKFRRDHVNIVNVNLLTRSHSEMWPWTLTYQKFLLCVSSQGQDLDSHQKLNNINFYICHCIFLFIWYFVSFHYCVVLLLLRTFVAFISKIIVYRLCTFTGSHLRAVTDADDDDNAGRHSATKGQNIANDVIFLYPLHIVCMCTARPNL